MKLATTIFAIGIGVYYIFGVYTSLFWADYYYAIVFGYICSLISNSKMQGWHRKYAYFIALTIWSFYMIKQFISDIDVANWIRWVLGIIFVFSSLFYYFKTKGEQ